MALGHGAANHRAYGHAGRAGAVHHGHPSKGLLQAHLAAAGMVAPCLPAQSGGMRWQRQGALLVVLAALGKLGEVSTPDPLARCAALLSCS